MALLPVQVDPSPLAPRFDITELLEPERPTRKRAKPGAAPSQGSHLVPLSPIQSPAHKSTTTQQGKLAKPPHIVKDPRTAGQQYVQRLEQPENTELFTYASALCHRVTGRYLAREHLQRDPGAQQKEIARIQADPELLQAIGTIRTLSKEFKAIAQDTLGHRRELGHSLLRIEESYLKLFEKLLELSLRMYWRYEQEHEAARLADKATINYWQDLHNGKAGEAVKLQKLLDGKEIVLRTQQIQLKDLEKQCSEMSGELSDQRALEQRVIELQATERDLRARERGLVDAHHKLKLKHEEMILYQRGQLEESHEQHKRRMDEMKRALREKEKQLVQNEKEIHELKVLTTPPVVTTAATQTEVDDDGLWDTQDGVPRYVSKSVLHRMAWRRFNAFMSCKNCRGRPVQQPHLVAAARDPASKEADEDYVNVWTLTRDQRNGIKTTKKQREAMEAEWYLPEPIMLFLSNLPKSVVAFPLHSLAQVIKQIEEIYDDKHASDLADEADGVAREELPNYICEFFLKTHGLRQSAEIGLYRLLVAVKHSYQRHSHVHLFARFCGLLRGDDPVDSNDTETTTAVGAGTLMATLLQQPRRGYLDRSFLRVFLHARHYLLRPAPARPRKNPSPQPHVVRVDELKAWVPLDHAVAIMRWYVGFLPEDSVVGYCREVEYSTAIYAGKAITEISGNRLAVRAEMRKAMLANADDNETTLSDSERVRKPRIVADAHKVLLLLLHALEQRRNVMEKALITMFDAGDVNHDCVLSLDEFKAIIRTRAESFSDRRVVRMFREALMGGSDQSFALSMPAFVKVCSDHGLVTLLPDDRWVDPFHRGSAVEASTNVKTAAVGRLSVALKSLSMKSKPAVPDKEASTKNEDEKAVLINATAEIPEELPEEPTERIISPRAEEVEEVEGLWEW